MEVKNRNCMAKDVANNTFKDQNALSSPKMRSGRATTVIITILIGVLVAGCSNQKPTTATTTTIATMPTKLWVNQICSALDSNFNSINIATNGYKSSFNSKEQLTTAQQNLVSFLSQVQNAYQTLLTQVSALKPPAVRYGVAAASKIKLAVHDAYDSVAAAIVLAQNIPTNDVTSFHVNASQLSLLLKDALTKTNSLINQVQDSKQSKTLALLFAKNQSCPS